MLIFILFHEGRISVLVPVLFYYLLVAEILYTYVKRVNKHILFVYFFIEMIETFYSYCFLFLLCFNKRIITQIFVNITSRFLKFCTRI